MEFDLLNILPVARELDLAKSPRIETPANGAFEASSAL